MLLYFSLPKPRDVTRGIKTTQPRGKTNLIKVFFVTPYIITYIQVKFKIVPASPVRNLFVIFK